MVTGGYPYMRHVLTEIDFNGFYYFYNFGMTEIEFFDCAIMVSESGAFLVSLLHGGVLCLE